MIDRTDLVLMLLKIEIFKQLSGEEMPIYSEEIRDMIDLVETLEIADAPHLEKMLGFPLPYLGERVEILIDE